MSKHIHAELMMQYAQDAMETDKPWERWQNRQSMSVCRGVAYGEWRDCSPSDMTFPLDFEYRRKPRTININGHEVPEPEREPLAYNKKYFAPAIGDNYLAAELLWVNDSIDNRYLERGFVHLSREAALAHAKALLSFTAKELDNE